MSRVFIPHLPTKRDPRTGVRVPYFDLSAAEDWGFIKVICDVELNPRLNLNDFDTAMAQVAAKAPEIRPCDYILAIGDVVLISATIARVMTAGQAANVLRWDKESKAYDNVEIQP